jgi:hypothetical protein
VQVTTLPEYTEVYNIVNKLRVESVVAIEGVVRPRPADAINADMKTGAIEVLTGRCCTFFDFFKSFLLLFFQYCYMIHSSNAYSFDYHHVFNFSLCFHPENNMACDCDVMLVSCRLLQIIFQC